MGKRSGVGRVGVVILGGVLLGGCASNNPTTNPDMDPSRANLYAIHTAYTETIAASGKAPRSEKDLHKAFPEQDQAARDQLFRSPHDKKPYTIVWGVMLNPEQPMSPAVLAHEQDGVGGNRWVLFTDGSCQRMTQAEFDKAPKVKR